MPSDIVLPSVNEYLPIGESDLPHALPWDSINPVDWQNDWEKINFSCPEDPELVSALVTSSTKRQEELEEFVFLKEQIEWRRQRLDEKEFSLNLEARISRKIREADYIEELDATYEALQANDYTVTELILDIAEKQEALSEKNQEKPLESSTTEESELAVAEGTDEGN